MDSFRICFIGLVCAGCMLVGAQPAAAVENFHEPTEIKSVNGVLNTTVEAKDQTLHFGSIAVAGQVYNGDYGGTVLRASPGDIMRIKLVNHLHEETNLHFHGLHSSPLAHGDNMAVVVQPGQSFEYTVNIPKSQSPGLYWFHAHIHGKAEKQINNGLSGTIVVEGIDQQLPQLKGMKEKIFALKDYQMDSNDNPEAKELHKLVRTINGQTFSSLEMHKGETQLWRFSNQSANLIYNIALKGHKLRLISTDGVVTNQETSVDSLEIGPASRREVLVDAGEAGSYDLVAEHTMTGTGEHIALERSLARLTVSNDRLAGVDPIKVFPAKLDLRTQKIDEKRTFSFTELADDKTFYLNGKRFDHERIDTRVPLGNTEEWTVKNDSDDMHAFHIHQIHFQVTEINGVPQPFEGYVDDVRVPERGEVKLILPFTDPQIVGTFMYHCHVLKHEDGGMMANIEVYDPRHASVVPPSNIRICGSKYRKIVSLLRDFYYKFLWS